MHSFGDRAFLLVEFQFLIFVLFFLPFLFLSFSLIFSPSMNTNTAPPLTSTSPLPPPVSISVSPAALSVDGIRLLRQELMDLKAEMKQIQCVQSSILLTLDHHKIPLLTSSSAGPTSSTSFSSTPIPSPLSYSSPSPPPPSSSSSSAVKNKEREMEMCTQPLVIHEGKEEEKERKQEKSREQAEDLFAEMEREEEKISEQEEKGDSQEARRTKRKSTSTETGEEEEEEKKEREKEKKQKSDKENDSEEIEVVLKSAKENKEEGDKQFQMKKYHSAMEIYQSIKNGMERIIQKYNIQCTQYGKMKEEQEKEGKNEWSATLIHFLDEYSELLSALISCSCKMGEYKESMNYCHSLLSIQPDWYKANSLTGTVYFYQKQWEKAVEYYTIAEQCECTQEQRKKVEDKRMKAELQIKRQRNEGKQRKMASSPGNSTNGEGENTVIVIEENSNNNPNTTRPIPSTPVKLPLSSSSSSSSTPLRTPLRPLQSSPLSSRFNASSPLSSSTSSSSVLAESLLPSIRMVGLRDLLGGDRFIHAVELFDNQLVHRYKVEMNPLTDRPTIRSTCYQTKEKNKEMKNLYEQTIEFVENRVNYYSCSCSQEAEPIAFTRGEEQRKPARTKKQKEKEKEERIEQVIEKQLDRRAMKTTREGIIVPAHPPCEHIGAVLLVIKKKQEEERGRESAGEENDKENVNGNLPTPSIKPKREPLYVHPSHQLSVEEERRIMNRGEYYNSLTVADLKSLLKLNDQKTSGNKNELVQRCATGEVMGVIPRCSIDQGHIYYANGLYRCSGGWDHIYNRPLPCDFITSTVNTVPWKSR